MKMSNKFLLIVGIQIKYKTPEEKHGHNTTERQNKTGFSTFIESYNDSALFRNKSFPKMRKENRPFQ